MMTKRAAFALCFLLIVLAGCAAQPVATLSPSPVFTPTIKKVVVTQIIVQPSATAKIITATPLPTETPLPVTPTITLPHEWVDYGGICMRPDNILPGVQINPDGEVIGDARRQVVEALWYLIEASGNDKRISPRFTSRASFSLATLSGAQVNGPFLPIGDGQIKSYFRLADPVTLWQSVHPEQKIQGISLDTVCLEYFDPLEFRAQQEANAGNHSVILTLPQSNEMTSAIFAPEEVMGVPRLVIKLLKNPYGERNNYPEFQGFLSGNDEQQNAQAANDHLGVLIACLNRVEWANLDSDKQLEFGLNWMKNRKPLKSDVFRIVQLFAAAP